MKDIENITTVAVVADFKYLHNYFENFNKQLRTKGNFKGDLLIITTYFCPTFLIRGISKKNKVIVLRFKKIKFKKNTNKILNNLETFEDPNRNKTKKFQWHKLNLFDIKLKQWDYIFYLDINMNIHFDINILLKDLPKNSFQARADSYPNYDRKLDTQFDKTNLIYEDLRSNYDLSVNDYFQTGVVYYDTTIINENTKAEIIKLVERFPISITNEQGILNLYFYLEKKLYKELPTDIDGYLSYFYWMIKDKKVIITKALKCHNE